MSKNKQTSQKKNNKNSRANGAKILLSVLCFSMLLGVIASFGA